MKRISLVSPLLVALMTLTCCRTDEPRPKVPGSHSAERYDTSPIALDRFPDDPAVYHRVLHMRFGEAAARLGSLRFLARSSFVFSRGASELEQNDTYLAIQDSLGNYQVLLDTPESQIEVLQVNEQILVRHDRGHLRSKPRRELELQAWREIAFSSMYQVLSLFRSRLAFGPPTLDKATPRPALRFPLGLTDKPVEVPPPPSGLDTPLPVSPPARWRELARPLDLRGDLWLDADTGVPTKLVLDGRLEIADRQVRPTQLSLRFDAAVTDAGKVASVKAGDALPEFERRRRVRDPLSFFRDQLAPLEPVEEAAPSPP